MPLPIHIQFGREICGNPINHQREWLVTNGIGGYASGTIGGHRSRAYHGLLVAALKPPLGRTLLLAKLNETATYYGSAYELFHDEWEDDRPSACGYLLLESFHLEGTTPVWTYAIADSRLQKRIWMPPGENSVCIRYTLLRGSNSLHLKIQPLIANRSHHDAEPEAQWQPQSDVAPNGIVYYLPDGTSLVLAIENRNNTIITAPEQGKWQRGYLLNIEQERGLVYRDSLLAFGVLEGWLAPCESLTVIARANPQSLQTQTSGDSLWKARYTHEVNLLTRAAHFTHPALQQLVLAADQFIVRRALPGNPNGHTVIAGYPWFSDWGRDTMIALPGLTLSTGRPEIAASLLRTFAHYVSEGMLPNRFPYGDAAPEYNTVDATLWYFDAIRAYHTAIGDTALVRELYPILQDILRWHQRGTRYNIHLDPNDGLLYAGQPGVQLTWMDAKVGNWVVTPRIGKPVEINALWYNALRIMADFAELLSESPLEYVAAAQKAHLGFRRFWNPELDCCFDVLDTPNGKPDPAIRPNQIFAVSLQYSPLDEEQQHAVVQVCDRYLVTSHGLRSLSPEDPAYIGVYFGNQRQRDAAYHQGAVWSWLIGAFVRAHLRVYRDPKAARAYLLPLLQHLNDAGVGSMSEIFEGNPPHKARACFAQAWSVAEVLSAWQATEG